MYLFSKLALLCSYRPLPLGGAVAPLAPLTSRIPGTLLHRPLLPFMRSSYKSSLLQTPAAAKLKKKKPKQLGCTILANNVWIFTGRKECDKFGLVWFNFFRAHFILNLLCEQKSDPASGSRCGHWKKPRREHLPSSFVFLTQQSSSIALFSLS